MKLQQRLTKLADWLLDLFFPTRCVFCRRLLSPGRPRICERCERTMPQTDRRRVSGNYYSARVSALYYERDVKTALRRYKFSGAQAYSHAFGELLAELIYSELAGEYDILSWAPVAPDRLRERGYDQAELMARDAARRLRCEAVPLLVKRRGVPPQSRLDEKARRKNVDGAYSLLPGADVEGKRVLLIDDVATTGSTLSECAKVLLRAGAEDVVCATLAMTR